LLGEQAIVELISAVGFYVMVAMLLNAFERSGSRRQKTTELRSPCNKLREFTPMVFLLDSRRAQVLKVYEAFRGR
jgi:hypothetical protein